MVIADHSDRPLERLLGVREEPVHGFLEVDLADDAVQVLGDFEERGVPLLRPLEVGPEPAGQG